MFSKESENMIKFLFLSYFMIFIVYHSLFTNHRGSFGKAGKEEDLQEHSF
jgi:hypothetical protein